MPVGGGTEVPDTCVPEGARDAGAVAVCPSDRTLAAARLAHAGNRFSASIGGGLRGNVRTQATLPGVRPKRATFPRMWFQLFAGKRFPAKRPATKHTKTPAGTHVPDTRVPAGTSAYGTSVPARRRPVPSREPAAPVRGCTT